MDITYSCSHALQQNRQRGSDSGVLDFASWNCVRITGGEVFGSGVIMGYRKSGKERKSTEKIHTAENLVP